MQNQVGVPQRLDDVIDALGEPAFVARSDGRIEARSAALVELLGEDPEHAHDAFRAISSLCERSETVIVTLHAARAPVELELSRPDGGAIRCRASVLTGEWRDRTWWRFERVPAPRWNEGVHRIYERMGEAFFALDQSWRLIYLNPVARQMRDAASDEAIGRVIWDEFPALRGTAFYAEYHRAMRERVPVHVVERFEDRWFEAKAYPSDEGLSIFFRDITVERRAAQELAESEERFRISFEHAAIGMAVLDLHARFLQVNPALCAMLGYQRDELLATGFASIEHPDDISTSIDHYRQMLGGDVDSMHVEKRLFRKDGSIVWVLATGAIVRDAEGKPRQFVAQLHDITERRAALEALRASERRSAQAYQAERAVAEQLRAVNEMKNAFLSAVSHDLRTPLTAVLGFAETLQERSDALDEETRDQVIAGLSRNARRLSRILTDLLDLDRLQRGLVVTTRQPVDMASLIERIVREVAADTHPLTIETMAVTAAVDPAQVERIVENLVTNAFKHTPAGTPISVILRGHERSISLIVEDEGPGVPPEARAGIFEAFRQGPGAPTHSPGVGIGLSLVARFAILHGGSAWVEDRPGGGARFVVTLPR